MLTGMINLRRLTGSKVRLNAALRRQHCWCTIKRLPRFFQLADDPLVANVK